MNVLMCLKISRCNSRDLPSVISFLDEEFIYSKCRNISLARRFPNVFSGENLHNLYLAWSDGSICAAAAVKMFDWIVFGRIWKGVMIGFVATKSELRGKGQASILMESVYSNLKRAGADFAVLWTTIPKFYEHLGWFLQDEAMFGQAIRRDFPQSCRTIFPQSLTEENIFWLENIRSKWKKQLVVRNFIDYKTIPVSVETVQCFSVEISQGKQAYAIVGERDRTGYVFEMIGHSSGFQAIWESLCQRYRALYVNDQPNTASFIWLDNNGYVKWEHQRQAMWLKLSHGMENVSVEGWYVPFFDHI